MGHECYHKAPLRANGAAAVNRRGSGLYAVSPSLVRYAVDLDDLNTVRNSFGATITTSWDGVSAFAFAGTTAAASSAPTGFTAFRDALFAEYGAANISIAHDDPFWFAEGDAAWWDALAAAISVAP